MRSITSTSHDLRLEQPPGLEELDPSLLEHERLRERSFSVHTHRTPARGRDEEKPRQGKWDRFVQEGARRVLNFTPSWFSVNMGTGITSILLYTLPYQFRGLKTIGIIIFFLNLALFMLFLLMSILRYIIWPNVFRKMLLHPQQSLFLGTFPMGFATIVNMVAFLTLDQGNDMLMKGWERLTWGIWWIDAAFSVCIGIGMLFVMFIAHDQHPQDVTGAWLLPPIANIVCSASGAIVAGYLEDRRAVITVIVSYILWGIGFGPTLLIMTVYFNRLAMFSVPANTVIVSSFIPLGPCGQGAFAILRLSSVVRTLCLRRAAQGGTGQYSADEWRMFGGAVYAGTVPVAFVIWGFGFVWLLVAIASILNIHTRGEKIPFNMGWWGFTFPIGVFTSATLQFGTELDSVAFKVLGTIFTVTLVILWLTVAFGTALKAWQGVIFMAPCLDDGGCVPPVQSKRVLTQPAEGLPVS
ncbi:Plasma membrane sulfite pump involved in sulfite metabolism [Naganishia albida]|nr:Plasma membrane sulfite pump involved in sulfite metabolism [Naganishia albida]